MALPTSSISQQAIKTALGTTESGVIALCQSAKINKWSGRKPFRSAADRYTYAELVAALKSANFGLQITGYSTAAAALNAAAGSSELWPYLRPLATQSSPCRQGDFRGYNHYAPVPYSSVVTANPGLSGYMNASFEVDVDQASGAEVIAKDMGTLSAGKWVILWRKSGGSTSVVQGDSVASATFPFSLNETEVTSAGTYEVCAAILANGLYYAVPDTYKTFQITIETNAANYYKMWCSVSCFLVQVDSTHYRIYTRMEISNGNATAQNTSWNIIIEDTVNSNSYNYQSSAATSVPAGGSVVFTPGQSVVTADIGDGSGRVAWGVVEVTSQEEDGLSESDFNISGWYTRGNNRINFSFQMEQMEQNIGE